MSRKILRAALALTLAGGVYLGAQPAEASNMGFKLERSFDLVREPGGRPYLNLYLLSFPYFNGLGDVANSGMTPANKCVGDPMGPAAGDGVINADDAICDLWTSRQGSFQIQRVDRNSCTTSIRTATAGGFGITFGGTFTQPLETDIGYIIQISAPTGVSPQNRGVVVGSHDPSYPGRPIISGPMCMGSAPRRDVVSLPYHSMLQTANEMLCGLENVDWTPDAMGNPTDCPDGTQVVNAGIPYDNVHSLQVQTYDNEVTRGYLFRSVSFSAFTMRDQFSGTNFTLRPGDAYIFIPGPLQVPTTFLSPHF